MIDDTQRQQQDSLAILADLLGLDLAELEGPLPALPTPCRRCRAKWRRAVALLLGRVVAASYKPGGAALSATEFARLFTRLADRLGLPGWLLRGEEENPSA